MHLYTLGMHSRFKATKQAPCKKVLVEHKAAFDYDVKDMPGDSGDLGHAKIEVTEGHTAFESAHRRSDHSTAIPDEICGHLFVSKKPLICWRLWGP